MPVAPCRFRVAPVPVVFVFLSAVAREQEEGPDANRKIAGGGITAAGWQGAVDASSAKAGQSEKDAKLVQKGGEFDVTTGPPITYWNAKNMAAGDYTVSATFT